MEQQELRAYFFQNMYLQGIHAGIQSQHTTGEMFVKYNPNHLDIETDCVGNCPKLGPTEMLYEWANEHKTTIVLNGGYAENLYRLVGVLADINNPYPWAYFKESKEALGGVLTNVGIILPQKIFNFSKEYGDPTFWLAEKTIGEIEQETGLSTYDLVLAKELSQCRLMN